MKILQITFVLSFICYCCLIAPRLSVRIGGEVLMYQLKISNALTAIERTFLIFFSCFQCKK